MTRACIPSFFLLKPLYPMMLGWERDLRTLASSSSLCPNCVRACLLFTFLTAQGDLTYDPYYHVISLINQIVYLNFSSPEGLLQYRNTLTPVPNPIFLRKGVAGMWTDPGPPPGPGVTPPALETTLLLRGVLVQGQGSGSAILDSMILTLKTTFQLT